MSTHDDAGLDTAIAVALGQGHPLAAACQSAKFYISSLLVTTA